MLNPSGVKIWRPRQLYLGYGERNYVDTKDRQLKEDGQVFDAPVKVSHGGDSKRNQLATYKDEAGEKLRSKL
jgi:citrate synthase